MSTTDPDRRTFLARLGLLGAVACSTIAFPDLARAAVTGAGTDTAAERAAAVDALRPVLADLTLDTFCGLAAFVVPGRDAWSTAQGTPRREPGAIAADTPDFLIDTFDHLVPLPQEVAQGMARGIAEQLSATPVPLPAGLPALPPGTVRTLHGAVHTVLSTPDTIPLSQLIALMLNMVGTQVNPDSVSGRFQSPFARLTFSQKAAVFSVLEDADPALVAAIASQVPEPMRQAVPGMLQYLVGGMLAFPAFGTYGEWSTFDKQRGRLTGRPVGWDIARYDPGVLDGWDDLTGYYQDRREVSR
jgi:hypothetical protein